MALNGIKDVPNEVREAAIKEQKQKSKEIPLKEAIIAKLAELVDFQREETKVNIMRKQSLTMKERVRFLKIFMKLLKY